MSHKRDYYLKVIILGESAVGKTSLVLRFVSNRFMEDYRSTIGTNIYMKDVKLSNGHTYNLNLWDIAGQERWARMRHKYYKGGQGAIIVGDLTRPSTFDQIKDFWIPDLSKFLSDIPILLVGNKNDLDQTITYEEIEDLKDEIGAMYKIITSAKTGENVETAFKTLTREIIKENNRKN
ncbi:MAG: Small GTP-binding domain protein [Promethearchaeota archaeon]|jgi:small GTP-binding protein|nr:MAG: Small GTP-binding domain protein [Candidatus Lokiarchaeota archaeon]